MPSSRRPSDAALPRMAALACLPLFFDLRGKSALVAGGSPAAAWKAELLAAAGAEVRVAAAQPSVEMQALLERGASDGSLALLQRAWAGVDLLDCALAVCDASGPEEAAAFAMAARSQGVPCNVIDDKSQGDFAFGAIVNRSPVVIGISSGGSAPALAQALRRRIETLLPSGLARWGATALALRQRVKSLLPSPPARRAFWNRFAEAALTAAPAAAPDAIAARLLAGADPQVGGSVTLVGAGPGDAELLTLKAVRALQAADVILFDDLVSGEVLELARREARRMLVGKRGRRESCRQEEINDLMLRLARQGRKVVRLKSGDPMIFGRAGEEIACLRAAGIPVEVVPGIAAALGEVFHQATAELRAGIEENWLAFPLS